MSSFSGKCDCYDTLIMIHEYTEDELKNNVKIYIGESREPLYIEKASDLIPYYPHIISFAYHNNEDRESVVHLTSKPYTDICEEETLGYMLKGLLRYYNRCKRKKIEYSVDDAVKESCWRDWNKHAYVELANRIKEKGKKATIDGIHLKMQEYYRQRLVEEMLKHGLNPADYGYERFVE